MLQLLIQLLTQPCQFIGIAQLFGVSLFVVQARVGAIHSLIVGVGSLAPRLWPARTIIAFRCRGIVVRLSSFIVCGVAFHFLWVGTQHAVLFGLALARTVLLLVLLAGLFAAFFAFLGLVLGVGVGFGLCEIERCQKLARGARVRRLVVLRTVHLRKRGVRRVAQRIAPHIKDTPRRLG